LSYDHGKDKYIYRKISLMKQLIHYLIKHASAGPDRILWTSNNIR